MPPPHASPPDEPADEPADEPSDPPTPAARDALPDVPRASVEEAPREIVLPRGCNPLTFGVVMATLEMALLLVLWQRCR